MDLLVKNLKSKKLTNLSAFYETNYWSPADKINQLKKSESFVFQLSTLKKWLTLKLYIHIHMLTLYTKNRYKKTIAVIVANYVVAN